MLENFNRYKKYAPEFKKVFNLNLMPNYWNHLTGLDIPKFDKAIETPENVSMRDHIKEKYGDHGVQLIKNLL